MMILNKIECEKEFRRDGNTEYTPIVKVKNVEGPYYSKHKHLILLQIDNGKTVALSGLELKHAIENAFND